MDAESFWILAKNRRRPDGTLFPPKDREVTLFRADLGTGAATLVGGTGLFENGMGVAVGPLDDLLGVNNNTLYRFDRITAVPTLIGPVGFDAVSGLEFLDLQGRVESQCMCSGPQPSVFWKGHGEFMACVSHASTELMRDGLISGAERGRIVREAARSECGK